MADDVANTKRFARRQRRWFRRDPRTQWIGGDDEPVASAAVAADPVGVAVPLKHLYGDASLVRAVGPVHGLLFVLYLLGTLRVGVEQHWRFADTTWKVLVASFVPFGTFYVDRNILAPLQR